MLDDSPRHLCPSRNEGDALNSITTSSLGGLTRDVEFWFDDGTMVLIAGNIAFKIYRGLLAAQSPVFADMVASGAVYPDQKFDGCPMVRLSDSPVDIRHLLRALVPKTSISVYIEHNEDSYTFNQLSSLIRLAHKYQIEAVQNQALACLKVFFTDEFDCWESMKPSFSTTDYSQAIGAVHLARLTDNPGMLPVAFYCCALLRGAVVDGWTREDGTIERLSAEDLKRCIDGYGTLCEDAPRHVSDTFRVPPHPLCKVRSSCRNSLLAMYELGRVQIDQRVVLHSWAPFIERYMEEYPLCRVCKNVLTEREITARRDIWRRLPSIFGLTELQEWEG